MAILKRRPRVKLQFKPDGKEVKIVFSNKEETTWYSSKANAFDAITGLAQEAKMNVSNFARIREEILNAKQLPE